VEPRRATSRVGAREKKVGENQRVEDLAGAEARGGFKHSSTQEKEEGDNGVWG